MVYCSRCGIENPPGSVFCVKCGTRLSATMQNESTTMKSLILQRFKSSSPRFKAVIAILVLAAGSLSAFTYFTGERDQCEGVDCGYRCYDNHLWKMRCFEGLCLRDYIMEWNSAECGYTTPAPTEPPEPSAPQKDTDRDGVYDEVDDCLNPGCTLVDARGCPKDSDSDGLQDCYDDCPHTMGDKSSRGCPVEEKRIAVEICLVNYNPPGNDNITPNDEWVKICNKGNQDANMSGWRLYDNAQVWGTVRDHVFVFPSGFILRAGQSVLIHTGAGKNTSSDLYFGRPPGDYAAIWNNDGDCAYLEDDQGNIVDEYCWG